MQHALLKLMHETEDSWWYRGRTRVVQTVLEKTQTLSSGSALDLGAGYGGMYPLLHMYAKEVDAYEPDIEAAAALKSHGYRMIYQDTDAALRDTHDLIGLFDVLEHIEDDRGVLARLFEVLTPGGTIVFTVPAYQWLWSIHDEHNVHFRRYTRTELREKLITAGFDVRFIGYWDMFLLPVAALLRLLNIAGEGSLSPGKIVNTLLFFVIRVEAFLMRFSPLPFGVSIIALARK